MSYPRVNLLKKSEQRYQGMVSKSFILLTSVGGPVLLLVLIFGIMMAQNSSVKSQLASSKVVWENFGPRLDSYRAEKQGLTTSSKIMGLFEGWEGSRMSIVELMDEVQERVPSNIQFARMSIRSDAKGPVYKSAEALALNYSLAIDGQAVGQQAESQVLKLQKDLQASASVNKSFDSLKLVSMRNRQDADGMEMSDFRLLAESGKGEGK